MVNRQKQSTTGHVARRGIATIAGLIALLDSCLLILKDWSNGLTLDDKEIDKERGVIHQEWQLNQNAMMRIYDRSLPKLYPNNKYGLRLPIGLMSVVDHFKYQALRDYYRKMVSSRQSMHHSCRRCKRRPHRSRD